MESIFYMITFLYYSTIKFRPMAVQTINSKKRLEEITKIVKRLNAKQQETLLNELRKQELLTEAEELAGSVSPNKISMQDIVKEVRKVRAERYAKRK